MTKRKQKKPARTSLADAARVLAAIVKREGPVTPAPASMPKRDAQKDFDVIAPTKSSKKRRAK